MVLEVSLIAIIISLNPATEVSVQTRVETSIGPVIVYQKLSDREMQLVECAFDVLGKHPPSYVLWSGEIRDRAGYFRGKKITVSPTPNFKIGDDLRFDAEMAFGIYLGPLKFKGKMYQRAGIWQSKVGPVLKEYPKHLTLINVWRADDH